MLTASKGGSIVIRKRSMPRDLPLEIFHAEIDRYSEFDDLRRKLLMTFPNSGGAMPPLPPKSVFCELRLSLQVSCFGLIFGIDKFRPSFLEKRRAGLAYFLKSVDLLCALPDRWLISTAAVSYLIRTYRVRP